MTLEEIRAVPRAVAEGKDIAFWRSYWNPCGGRKRKRIRSKNKRQEASDVRCGSLLKGKNLITNGDFCEMLNFFII